jgi:hypothetical protein
MTAPGNSTLVLTLLAAFIASTGYAGGRLHQWYRMGRDRDEAYRDGYDTATRSVFSMAARVISPRWAERSAIRASASAVGATSAVITTAAAPVVSSSPHSGMASSGIASPFDQPQSGDSGPDGAAVVLPFARPVPTSSGNEPSHWAEPPAERRKKDAGGVVGSLRPPVSSGSGQATDGPDSIESSGRHFVPDELVQAATYRLPPDRVARAKVQGAVPPVAEPPVRMGVPKPRSS